MSKRNVVTIRNFKGLSDFLSTDMEEKWSILEVEIVSILNSQKCTNSFEELYRIAEDLYTQKYSPLLCNLEIVIEAYLYKKLESIQQRNVLEAVDEFWKEFCRHIKTIKNIFLCIDRSSKNFKYNKVQSLCLQLFSKIVVNNIKRNLVNDFLHDISLDRDGKKIDPTLLHSVSQMLNTLQIYQEIFQSEFLKTSRQFYQIEGEKLIEDYDLSTYLLLVNRRIEEELSRVKNYLSSSTENDLLNIVHQELIEKHATRILNKGFDDLINKNMFNELCLVYKLFLRILDGQKCLLSYFHNFIFARGLEITNTKNNRNMIQNLLDFKDKLEKCVTISFQNQNCFYESIRRAFKKFINKCNSRIAQLLAKYADSKLRSKDVSEEALEIVLGKIIGLFKYVQGKDIFEAFYKKHLAKRLLLSKFVDVDGENRMITKLIEECGEAFTSNIEGMFQDINLSKTINTTFKQRIPKNASDFSVNVLTSSYWPNYPNYDVNLPLDLITYQQDFQKFYLSNHSGRKLLWQPTLCHCLIRGNFDCGVKEFQASLYQAAVLLLFKATDSIGFREIQETTNLDVLELKKTLCSLTNARLLLKKPNGRNVDENDVFTFNIKYHDRLFRVKINQIQLQETVQQEEETEKNVLGDRQFQIDAAIVRVMKKRKCIKHNVLLKELYEILDVPVTHTALKKRIELLIEREYLERDKDDASHYIYIA